MAEVIDTGPAEDERPPKDERTPRAKTGRPKRKAESSEDSSGSPRKRIGADRKVLESLTSSYQMFGGILTSVGMVREDQGFANTGVVVIERSGMLAEAWMELADQNPQVKAALRKFTETSAAASLIALHFTCFIPLLIDRGVVPQGAAPFVMGAMQTTAAPDSAE